MSGGVCIDKGGFGGGEWGLSGGGWRGKLGWEVSRGWTVMLKRGLWGEGEGVGGGGNESDGEGGNES